MKKVLKLKNLELLSNKSIKNQEINIFWFRRDLRLEDNVGLQSCLQSEYPTLCLFIFDKNILSNLNETDQRVSFIFDCLKNLKKELQQYKSDLLVIFDSPEKVWEELIKSLNIKQVYSNEDYEPYAMDRDLKIKNLLAKNNIDFLSFKDQCIFAKDDILKKDGTPYTVYTPYKNKWLEKVTDKDFKLKEVKKYLKNLLPLKIKEDISLEDMGFKYTNYSFHLDDLDNEFIHNYHEERDFPAKDSTSKLGMHLRFGTISIRKYAKFASEFNQTWLSELIWREFFKQILFHFPYVVVKPFKKKYEKIKWRKNKKDFELWCKGETGYPLVDAGMRELNTTGFMHNRVRMVTGSFLIKHLLIDWRWGEKYFAEKLLDFDLSANNGNWQWVAGTGCDAAPYFRIFNPKTQLEKFDKNLEYVKKWVPEYGTSNYPKEMVDHKFAYDRALETYKEGLN